MSFDVLQKKIITLQNPTVAGLDARIEYVPQHIREKSYAQFGHTLEGASDAIWLFNKTLIDSICDIVPAVKPQAAYYENLGWQGMRVLEKTISYAQEKGLYVIADIKRGDIGTTASAYSEGWLGETIVEGVHFSPFHADCVTLNGYMGSDAIAPFLKDATTWNKSMFVLAKTSNPSSGELQDKLCGEKTVYETMGTLIEQYGSGQAGQFGFTPVGAVVGATYPEELAKLRAQMPHTFFLVPGYGAQGGTAADIANAFTEKGHGAIINASRSIMCAWQKTGTDGRDFGADARQAACAMQRDILSVLGSIASS